MQNKLLINNEWRAVGVGEDDGRRQPGDRGGDRRGGVGRARRISTPRSTRRARRSTGRGAKMSARERGRLVRKLGERLMERADEVARLETLHNGKPISESRHIEIPAAAECFEYYGGWSDKVMGETIPVKGNYLTYTLREPIGVVAAIVPWNFPLLLAAWKVAPALACGNTVILKPASQTPLTALALGEIAIEVGLAARRAERASPARVDSSARRSSSIPASTRSRSPATPAPARASCAAPPDTLKRITLELGGKSPNIVLADADIDAAIRGATIGIFYGKGEVCAAGSRLLVDRSIKDEFIDKLAARAKKMAPGDPLDPKTRFGALSSKKQLETVLRYIDSGKQEGATLVAGGARADIGTGKGYFVQPTVFADVQPDDDDLARGDLRPGARRDRVRRHRRSDRARQRHARTAWPPASGRATSRRRTTSRASSRRARSGSTPTTSTTPRRRSAATSRAASAAR